MPDLGRWSFIYHLDGRREPNQSIPGHDVFYTLTVLLGLSRIERAALTDELDLVEIFRTNVALVPRFTSPKYAYGMALWAGAELGFDIPPVTHAAIVAFIENRKNWHAFRSLDLGMILIGWVAQARGRGKQWAETAHDLFKFLDDRYSCRSGLFYDQALGGRRRFSSFATHLYLTLACYKFAEWSGSTRAMALAKTCTRKLIELQGPQGEWPWFYYTPGGRVVDWYEVYSVHQAGMAPALLECAEHHEVAGATDALVKGFNWVFGQNQLKRSMLWGSGLIYRSQVRRGERDNRRKRVIRALGAAITGRSGSLIDPTGVELRLECRSYELGWILWSFGRRRDLAEIQFHPQLS